MIEKNRPLIFDPKRTLEESVRYSFPNATEKEVQQIVKAEKEHQRIWNLICYGKDDEKTSTEIKYAKSFECDENDPMKPFKDFLKENPSPTIEEWIAAGFKVNNNPFENLQKDAIALHLTEDGVYPIS